MASSQRVYVRRFRSFSARPVTAPSGIPAASDLAMVTTSGTTPLCSMANSRPVRPKPHWTSSATKTTSCSSQIWRSRWSQGTGAGSWADSWFGWVFVIEPSSQAVRMWHLTGMWVMVAFAIVHIYMVIRADVMSRQNGVSAMIDGVRRFKDDDPRDPQ